MRRTGRSVDRASNRDPQIPAQSMDSCAKYGSTDCAARSMDCADPQIAPNIYIRAEADRSALERRWAIGPTGQVSNADGL